MSFFKSFKRALGFSGDDADEADTLYDDTTDSVAPQSAPSENVQAAPAPSEETLLPEAPQFTDEMRMRIFTRVTDIFTSALPDFLKKSSDQERQRQLLLEALDADIKAYMASLEKACEDYSRAQWHARQAALSTELESLKARTGDIEKKSAEVQQRQLSADRQKRALSDRVRDLEAQVASFEAEREQFELENRSLVNRLKVANVQQEDVEGARAEIERLKLELKTIRENPDAEANRKIEALNTQISEMTQGIDALKEERRLADEMMADLRARLNAKAKEDSAGKELNAQLQSALDEAQAKLDEANKMLEEYKEVAERMDEVDKLMTRREEKIKAQKKALASRDAEIESLKQTISENLRLQAEREAALKAEIKELLPKTHRSAAATAEAPALYGEESAPRISDTDLSAIEQTFESDEWFTKTPPPETPSMRPADDNSDFGYQAPKRKQPPHNPNQLSLFE